MLNIKNLKFYKKIGKMLQLKFNNNQIFFNFFKPKLTNHLNILFN